MRDNVLLFYVLIISPILWASDLLVPSPALLIPPNFTIEDRQNVKIIENLHFASMRNVLSSLRRKTAYFPRDNGSWLRASILQADPDNNSADDLQLLRRARETVFKSFREASPEYTEKQWARVKRLDPLFRPRTFVIIIEDLDKKEVVGNLKLVYDYPGHPLPAEQRFLGAYTRSAPEMADVHLFNFIQGQVQKLATAPVGGAIQVMELYGPGYTSELMFLANLVLAEHPKVQYKIGGNVYETYPKDIIGYGVASEMGGYHAKMGLEIIARDGDYLMHKTSTLAFQNLYKDNFIFRPGAKRFNKRAVVYQSSGELDSLIIQDIFQPYPEFQKEHNKSIIKKKMPMLREHVHTNTIIGNKDVSAKAVQNAYDYYSWALGGKERLCKSYYNLF